MVLRNFYGWLYSTILSQRTTYFTETNNNILDINGNTFITGVNSSTYTIQTMCLHNTEIHIGSGSSQPAYDDYCLENRITDITNSAISYTRTQENGYSRGIFTYSGVYSGEETIIVKEIGIIKNIYSNSTSTTKTVLFTRSLLETPLVLNTGDSFSIQTELVLGAK